MTLLSMQAESGAAMKPKKVLLEGLGSLPKQMHEKATRF